MAGQGAGEQEAHTLTARLAAQIIERARHLDLPADSHLTEQELANAFQVSRTPVRLALHALADMGLVERRPNRGFFLKRAAGVPGDGAVPAAADGADEDPLYFRMAEDRLTGKLDAKVEEADVARRYGASRARVARLLARMAQEGWVSRLPGHGWAFQPLLTSPESYDQGYRYRMVIEPAAVLEPGYAVDPAAFSQARAQQRAMLEGGIGRWSRSETFTVNSGFHEVIVAGSGNLFLLEGLRRVNRLRRLLEYRTHVFKDRLMQECRDHLVLLDMIEGGKRAKAAEFLHQHLNRARLAKTAMVEGRVTPPP